ncbi:unnamed protein product [Dibothriocephalus latus]|uniref:Uncharacterized protein n=1 Tax=Dibothriocephalus latus TaxID=60516 RepID=A0A3P7LY14_DIBLA|nr:unnamed protein product [Dibothriocephalus latus]
MERPAPSHNRVLRKPENSGCRGRRRCVFCWWSRKVTRRHPSQHC